MLHHGLIFGLMLLVLSACSPASLHPDAAVVGHDLRAGARLFRGTCAACHGESGMGNGPVAPLLNVPVPDLTRIAARRNGEFPELEVFRIIDGQSGACCTWGSSHAGLGIRVLRGRCR